MSAADAVRGPIYGAARDRYDNVYVNPTGVVVVPHGLTSVTSTWRPTTASPS